MQKGKSERIEYEKGDLSLKKLKEVGSIAYENATAQQRRRNVIAKRLKLIRAMNKVTQKELCEKINVVITTYAGYEQSKHDIPTEVIARIAELFDISTDYIIGITDNPKGKYADDVEKKLTDKENEIAHKVEVLTKLIDKIENKAEQ